MHEFTDHNSQNNDGIPEGWFNFEQISALMHMRYFYYEDPEMPGLAKEALKLAREDTDNLEAEVGRTREMDGWRQLGRYLEEDIQLAQFLMDYDNDFARMRQQAPEMLVEPSNYDDDPANLNHYGAHFDGSEGLSIIGIRQVLAENPTAGEGDIVRLGHIRAGELMLEAEAERKAQEERDERLRRLFGPDDSFLHGDIFGEDTPD